MELLCTNCMKKTESTDVCPYCGRDVNSLQSAPFLPKKTLISERYLIGLGLDADGESLGYIGYDLTKDERVYVKEFYPANLCRRNKDFKTLSPIYETKRVYENLMQDYVKYFSQTANLRNLTAIAAIYDIIRENETVYIICEWIDGVRLGKYIGKKSEKLEWEEAKAIFIPLISSLVKMSSIGIHHLGICPDNILITPENRPKLIGFSTKNLRVAKSTLENEFHEGCTALEQYTGKGEIGESADVYGLAATLFVALSGEYPASALLREQDDRLLISEDVLKNIPEHVIVALSNALRVQPQNRTLSFETFRLELTDSPVLKVKSLGEKEIVKKFDIPKEKESSSGIWGILAVTTALLMLIGGLALWWMFFRNPENNNSSQNNQTEIEIKDDEPAVSEKISVPDLVGKRYQVAIEELGNSTDYKIIMLSEEYSDAISEGCIISQNPSFGEEMLKGSTVAITISKGTKQRILPAIAGATLAEASQLLNKEKIIPVEIREENSDYDEGIVVGYKDYKVGDKVNAGSEVKIVVSKGID